MSTFAVLENDGTVTGSDAATKDVREKLNAAREWRKQFEPTWHMNLAYAAGKFWLKWDRDARQLVTPPAYANRELYSADVITEYRTTALGELGSDDDRPNLLLRREDQPSEDFQEQLNRAVSWGWDYEWMGDEVLEEMRRYVVDLGTAGVRCRFDPTVGPNMADSFPHMQGKPIFDQQMRDMMFANGPNPDVQMMPLKRGCIRWETISTFNMLVPPGIPHEKDFPWEGVIRPVLLDLAKPRYPALGDAKEDTDIGSLMGLTLQAEPGSSVSTLGSPLGGKQAGLRGHIWLTTYYERPTPRFPQGRTIVFGTNKMIPLEVTNSLPYQRPDGTWSAGIAYFHWWRVSGRFWSRGLVEVMKDPQRSINKRRTQIDQMIDRGMPAIFVERNSKAKDRRGLVNELIELAPNERQPTVFNGVSPGEWMYHDIEEMRADLEHATGIRGPSLGENPQNVTTYAQLALINENDATKRQQIQREMKLGVAHLVEFSVSDMRTYWGADRQITLAGEEDSADATVFNATSIPPFFIVKVAKGAAQPRSQGAELKKIEELWNAALSSGAVAQNPIAWVNWLKESFDNGQAGELPDMGQSVHEEKARLENHKLIEGEPVTAQYYDPLEVHIPIHREAQVEAEMNDDLALWQQIEDHVQRHLLVHQQTQQLLQQMAPAPAAPTPGAPDQGGPPGPALSGSPFAPSV